MDVSIALTTESPRTKLRKQSLVAWGPLCNERYASMQASAPVGNWPPPAHNATSTLLSGWSCQHFAATDAPPSNDAQWTNLELSPAASLMQLIIAAAFGELFIK